MKVSGPALADLDALGDRYAGIVLDAARAVLEQAARRLGTPPSPDDLKFVTTRWPAYVDGALLPELASSLWYGVDVVHGGLARGAAALTAAIQQPDDLLSLFVDVPGAEPPPGWPPEAGAVPRVSSGAAQAYLQNRRNALVGIGDDLWSAARAELVAGQQAGEGVARLKQRVMNSLDVSAPRAEAVARTEVNGAANAGSLAEAHATGLPGTKEWIATPGKRTRKDHAHADGQRVDLDAKFSVGGHAMDGPHDQLGPASEVVNCRCTLGYDFPDDAVTALVARSASTGYRPNMGFSDGNVDVARVTQMRNSSGNGDFGLLELIKLAGIEGPGDVIPASEFDQLDWVKMYRGMDADTTKIAQQYGEAWRTGDYYPCLGIFGNGAYFSNDVAKAETYAGSRGVIVRTALRPNARVINFDDLEQQVRRLAVERDDDVSWMYVQDPSKYAIARGYDVIHVPSHSYGSDQYYVILNRSAVVTADDA